MLEGFSCTALRANSALSDWSNLHFSPCFAVVRRHRFSSMTCQLDERRRGRAFQKTRRGLRGPIFPYYSGDRLRWSSVTEVVPDLRSTGTFHIMARFETWTAPNT
jgi:hypothetical protein